MPTQLWVLLGAQADPAGPSDHFPSVGSCLQIKTDVGFCLLTHKVNQIGRKKVIFQLKIEAVGGFLDLQLNRRNRTDDF